MKKTIAVILSILMLVMLTPCPAVLLFSVQSFFC